MLKYLGAMIGLTLSTVSMAKEPVTLSKDNFVLIRGEVSSASMAKAMVNISLIKGNNPVLFIQSPGGSVVAGMQFIQYMKDSGKKFTCIADFAASMAFAILQACDERYVLNSSEIMQHQASYGIEGQANNIKSLNNHIVSIIDKLEVEQANRIGKPVEKFRADRAGDLWLLGDQAIKYGAADGIVSVKCDTALWQEKVKESMTIFIFKINLTYSGCPLARAPLVIDMGGGGDTRNEEKEQEARNKVMLMWSNLHKAVESIKVNMFKE